MGRAPCIQITTVHYSLLLIQYSSRDPVELRRKIVSIVSASFVQGGGLLRLHAKMCNRNNPAPLYETSLKPIHKTNDGYLSDPWPKTMIQPGVLYVRLRHTVIIACKYVSNYVSRTRVVKLTQ